MHKYLIEMRPLNLTNSWTLQTQMLFLYFYIKCVSIAYDYNLKKKKKWIFASHVKLCSDCSPFFSLAFLPLITSFLSPLWLPLLALGCCCMFVFLGELVLYAKPSTKLHHGKAVSPVKRCHRERTIHLRRDLNPGH